MVVVVVVVAEREFALICGDEGFQPGARYEK